jgi:hypothetical protein
MKCRDAATKWNIYIPLQNATHKKNFLTFSKIFGIIFIESEKEKS